jgi:hypothetical protein
MLRKECEKAAQTMKATQTIGISMSVRVKGVSHN